MAQVRGQLKRSILNSLARQAAANGVTLEAALGSYQDALIAGVKGGRVVEMTSGSGKAVKFRTPLLAEHFRQEDVAELSQEFLEIYSDATTNLEAQGNSAPDDATILAAMLADDRVQSVKVTRNSYTLLNYPTRF